MLDPLDQWDNAAKYPYMFDNYPLNQPTTNVMVQFAQSTLHVTKLGVIGDSTTFADALETDLKKSATQSGLQIAKTVAYTSQSTDVTTQVRQLKAAGANGIALLSEAGMGHVYDALRTVGWKPPIITTAASYFDGFTSLKNLAATTFSNCAIAIHKGQQPDAATTAVLTTVTKKTGVNPSVGQLVLTNDDLLILKSAIEKANSVDPAKIKAQIESVSGQGFTSPAFSYTFSADHHGGWPQSEIHMCDMSPLGPFDLPYFAGS
jgi:ABC-type branched-subunit amino acid transport system substrate-binding protein